jgi:hypothetical protein
MGTLTYLTLDELEALAFKFPGFQILAAQGPSGPEWHLRVPMNGVEVTMRAHRAQVPS